jgi:hypothetical protein
MVLNPRRDVTTTDFTYEQHPRAAELQNSGPPTVHKAAVKRHHSSVGLINNRIGLAITKTVGTMWAAYAFVLLALISLPAAISSGSAIIIVAWIAQTFLQLVLLPVIIVGQNIQAAASDDRAAATYKDAVAILEEAKQIQLHLASQDAAISGLLDRLHGIESKFPTQA